MPEALQLGSPLQPHAISDSTGDDTDHDNCAGHKYEPDQVGQWSELPPGVERQTRQWATAWSKALGAEGQVADRSSDKVSATRALAWPCPNPCSSFSQVTSSCDPSGQTLGSEPQASIGRPYFFSIEGK